MTSLPATGRNFPAGALGRIGPVLDCFQMTNAITPRMPAPTKAETTAVTQRRRSEGTDAILVLATDPSGVSVEGAELTVPTEGPSVSSTVPSVVRARCRSWMNSTQFG